MKIDKLIRPLIDTMNCTGWIETVSCCQGHRNSYHFPEPYIDFFCRNDKLQELISVLHELYYPMLDVGYLCECKFIFGDECPCCQEYTPDGWTALSISFKETRGRKNKSKLFDLIKNKIN